MDILDIDEALKDDSFIFPGDKSHDDVTNILQQWRNNNCLPSQTLQQQQQQEQQNIKQVYKLNSRTFTRPRRKSSQNLESQFSNALYVNGMPNSHQQHSSHLAQNGSPMLNLEIGGLVTTMHKSFLQDTSPPSSICSSLEASMDRMNNSLITSADFTNISFLQSTTSIDLNGDAGLNLYNKCTSDGYTLSDMIRDREALESLTMSGDGTLIKDSQIAQIDDISLVFSKTTSTCSTMDNSTESMECNNQTVECLYKDRTFDACNLAADESLELNRTTVLANDMICDTTFKLIENSMCATPPSVLKEQCNNVNETFRRPMPLDQTVCQPAKFNATFDGASLTPECGGTPENNRDKFDDLKFYESTPQTRNVRSRKQQYTPSLKTAVDVNISPIVASNALINVTLNLTSHYNDANVGNKQRQDSKVNSDTFSGGTLPSLDAEELIEDIRAPHKTFAESYQVLEQSAAGIEMQNVMDLAQAEAELLASNDDGEEFEQMLDEFSKVQLNAEQLRMKKSMDTIKKRFSHVEKNEAERLHLTMDIETAADRSARLHASALDESRNEQLKTARQSLRDSSESELRNSTMNSKDSLRVSQNSSVSSLIMSSISGGASTSGERLLGRRSRLYDDVNLSTLSNPANSSLLEQESQLKGSEIAEEIKTENTTIGADVVEEHESEANAYKLAEKRARDRERFKTIKIVKNRIAADGDLNVPCIDDDDADVESADMESHNAEPVMNDAHIMKRSSRRDQITNVFNNNKSESSEQKHETNKNLNFLTYKKPKEKQLSKHALPEVEAAAVNQQAVAQEQQPLQRPTNFKSRLEPRSLSRPRYISNLQKLSAVNKATSAGDLEKTHEQAAHQLNLTFHAAAGDVTADNTLANARTKPIYGVQKTTGDLKSPMGIKSKSFHNLSNNFGFSAAGSRPLSTFGLRKPNSGSILMEKQSNEYLLRNNLKTSAAKTGAALSLRNTTTTTTMQQQQKNDETVFKVPKLVSGIRAPAAAGVKRAALVRPSSGYYSTHRGLTTAANDADIEQGRHSPDSMSSASSRGSAQSNVSSAMETQMPATLTKLTTGATGITRPSGLRPPSQVKRSGLPRPSSLVRR